MLMTHIPMDSLVALAEQRQARLREEADRYRAARLLRGATGPSAVGRLWLRLRARLTAARRPGRAPGPAGPATLPPGATAAAPEPGRAPHPVRAGSRG
ncbi:hypothetical protein Ae406Ps2_4580c [Pseudonocardia sp. Ae406_Ps2]|uniref:hypothetical protein n=1 Tax=unclassified Pseudonocardia TaxID=2619320 RepID=UPI0002F8086A|nr:MULTISPECIES: hypothetical protein [unclassified Pseudonocardia]OLL97703.1 hypothetical protein Ae331Ps2_1370 [Pseudonocardia sp. Ae331_Ps2]OLM04580.1 hypothetical protein Ae406Ps2_4580c [Pseudonocardia sp. Ae406_Ps2]OLM10591.1 hypothetical protein Ae505Ps2_0714 [Pseudonocardia sp. Ae505_Ps2]OLM26148.1 hypothetical protein Ae706Ps2_4581c [Pseudonocardia sp. Ae706_Ps2]OLM33747.1 hypothetical protein Ae717Ps2_4643 [Pseudonocardia sp. Ae717_Ps2]